MLVCCAFKALAKSRPVISAICFRGELFLILGKHDHTAVDTFQVEG
jgi:hypothetical protein